MTSPSTRLSLRGTLLLGQLTVSLPAVMVAIWFTGEMTGIVTLGATLGLAAALSSTLARSILTPLTAASQVAGSAPAAAVAPSSSRDHPLTPAEVHTLIAALCARRHLPGTPRRRASDARNDNETGIPGPSASTAGPARTLDPALRDPLTHLANRRGLAEHLANVDGVRNLSGTTAIHCLRLTNLAGVEASHGRVVSETFLATVARAIAESVRATDLVARIGPSEVAIVQHDVRTRANAVSLAFRIRDLLERPSPAGQVHITPLVCIGIALAPPEAQEYTARLIDAEAALDQATAQGPGTIVVSPVRAAHIPARHSLVVGSS